MNTKYDGQLIYSTSDEFGPIDVVELQQKMRCLHFGNKTQQATMFLHNPILLVHKYTQAMLTPLCWRTPQHALALGLGGGSVVKHLLHYYPQVQVDAVELRPQVTRIAQEYFSLPQQDARLQITHCSAEDFLATSKDTGIYDLVLVDLFLTSGEKDISVSVGKQIDRLAQLLAADGSMCINIIGENHAGYPGLEELQKQFPSHLYMMPVDKSNIVLLASRAGIPLNTEIDFTSMERKYKLPFRQYFDQLRAI